jgi:hypothetical protein
MTFTAAPSVVAVVWLLLRRQLGIRGAWCIGNEQWAG